MGVRKVKSLREKGVQARVKSRVYSFKITSVHIWRESLEKNIKGRHQREIAFEKQLNRGKRCIAYSHELGSPKMGAFRLVSWCLVEFGFELRPAGRQGTHFKLFCSRCLHEAVSTAVVLSEELDEL